MNSVDITPLRIVPIDSSTRLFVTPRIKFHPLQKFFLRPKLVMKISTQTTVSLQEFKGSEMENFSHYIMGEGKGRLPYEKVRDA